MQVLPQKPTGTGKLSGIPFGAKDIIETRGLATEYGSPIYKGRVGSVDAAIVQELRNRDGTQKHDNRQYDEEFDKRIAFL